MAAPEETFTLLPLTIDPSSKAISSSTPTLSETLTSLNALHRTLLSLPEEAKTTPPPPLPVAPKRSAQVQKMREGGNAALRKATTTTTSSAGGGGGNANTPAHEALKLYTYGIEMALQRPGWEPASLVREEASALFSNRSQAYMALGLWAEGAADAATSVELKRGPGNGKAWWRRGKCLCEMGRWEEAATWGAEGGEVAGGDNAEELRALGAEVEARLKDRESRR